MKKDELYQLATDTCYEVIEKNKDTIDERIHSSLKRFSDENGNVSAHNAAAALSTVNTTLCPEISAIVTAKLLVKLGLVVLEDDE